MAQEATYVLVTGGDRGIGRAVALRFARQGFGVIITYRSNREAAEEVMNLLLDAGAPTAMYYQLDLADPKSIETLGSSLERTIPYLNVLVNNAGIIDYSGIEELSEEVLRKVIDVDLVGPILLTKRLLPLLKRAPWASIVNIASIAGETGNVVAGVSYVAAKAGLIGFTKKLAIELAKYRIRVNAVAPSFVETDMTRDYLSDPSRRAYVESLHPLGTIATPDDIAEAVLFLAMPQTARNITGHVLNVNGGRYT